MLTDPIASKDLPILNEYEKYYDKNLTSFTKEQWSYYQDFYANAYPRNQMIKLEGKLIAVIADYVNDEITLHQAIVQMNSLVTESVHEIAVPNVSDYSEADYAPAK